MMPTPSINTKEESCSSSSSKPPAKVSPTSSEGTMSTQSPQFLDQSRSSRIISTAPPPISIEVNEISQHDVLFGRGGGTNKHAGNVYFRTLVSYQQPVYVKSRKREKTMIAKAIVADIRSKGGRFLRKEKYQAVNIGSSSGSDSDRWVDVGDKKAAEKTSQALREGLGGKMREVVGKAGAGILQLKKIGFLDTPRLNERDIQMRLDDLEGLDDDNDDDNDGDEEGSACSFDGGKNKGRDDSRGGTKGKG
jgi:hypothetical protein